MTDAKLTAELTDLKEAVAAQTAGLMKLLALLATHGDMLKQIVAAITAEPTDESPLVETLKQLVAATRANGDALHRIEGAIGGRGVI
jgi:hypothetical protein